MTPALERVLGAARQLGASDVHLKVGLPPIFRIHGELRGVKEVQPLNDDALSAFAQEMMTPLQAQRFHETNEIDLAFDGEGGGRYRASVFRQQGHVGMVLRVVPPKVPEFDSLSLPRAILELADKPRGLLLVTGATGAGKTTTLASMVDYISRRRAGHVVTIEDPIEFIFPDRRCVVNQRELGLDTHSFASALRSALRQDPDVILLSDLRDLETLETALVAAETGHLVLSTLHTSDSVETINRVVTAFPPHEQGQVRIQLASVLVGVVCQRLIPRRDAQGVIPAVELLVNTNRVRDLILDPARTHEIREAIVNGRDPYGMISFDQSLKELVDSGQISYDQAVLHASSKDDFELTFQGVSAGRDKDPFSSPEEFMRQAGGELELDLSGKKPR